MEFIKAFAGPLSIVAASFVVRDGFAKAADVLGSHVENGLKGHMESDGAGQHLCAVGLEHLSNAVKDRKPYFSLLSFGL